MPLRRRIAFSACLALSFASVALADDDWRSETFTLTSSEFKKGESLPISAIYNGIVAGTNVCSINGAVGGDTCGATLQSLSPVDAQRRDGTRGDPTNDARAVGR